MMDFEEIVSDVLKSLSILVTPVTQTNTGSGSQNLLESLKGNLHKFEDFVKENIEFKDVWTKNVSTSSVKEDNVSWKFTSYCLKLLDILQENLKKASEKFNSPETNKTLTPNQAPSLSPDTLSFEQQKHILTSLQFIICLGVCPYLQDGVGIPMSKRSGFSNLLSDINLESKNDKHFQEAHLKLLICAKVFMTSLDIPSLAVLLLSRHLNDLLALLLQLNHLHKVKVDTLESTGGNRDTNTHQNQDSESSQTNVLFSSRTKEFCEIALKRLLHNVKPSMLVRELIILQGGPKSKKPGLLPPAPVWLREVCATLLSDILKKPHGVLHIILGVVGNEANIPVSQSSLTDWRKCDAAAKIIAHCPRNSISIEEYYQLIAPQILRLLEDGDNEKMKLYLRVCCSIIKEMSNQNESLTDQYIIKPIMNPLLQCLHSNDNHGHGDIIEQKLSTCIENLHKVFVCGGEPLSSHRRLLKKVIHPLFVLYCFSTKSSILIREKCWELLISYFKSVGRQEALDGLVGLSYKWIQPGTDQSLNQHVQFVTEVNGCVKLVTSNKIQEDNWDEDSDNKIECLKNLLKGLQSDGLAGDFFVFLLKKLTDIIRQETGSVTVNQNDKQVKEEDLLLEVEKKTLGKLDSFNQRLIILNLIAGLSESLDSTCFQSHQQILEFVKSTLERGVEICTHTEDDIFNLFESETMTMAIGLLTALMSDSSQKFTEEDRSKMEELVPLLNELAVNHPSDEIQEMATDIKIAIATRGIVISEILKSKRENKVTSDQVKEKLKETKPLIEVLSETSQMSSGLSETTGSKINNETRHDLISILDHVSMDPDSKLNEVFEELCHPEIPIRGHALLTLTKLIESHDKDIIKYQDSVLNILEQNLGHADTYLYLPSVNGMVAMVNILPDKVVPRLAAEFSKITGQKTSLQSEHKMKLGEALVKTSRVCGDMLPKYKNILLPAVLCGVKDTDPLIRASSLSNLTELSRLLHFSIGSHIHEIISCCGSILKSDKENEVRKAAALVFTHLLQGTGKDSFKILDTALKDLYRLLKSVYITESNDIVKVHITLALNELDQIMKEFLFPKQTLTKKIQVLSAD